MFYDAIPQMVEDNLEWADNVFERISKIYKTIDGDYFPAGPTQMCIASNLAARGVKVKW